MSDGRLTAPSDGKVYHLREAILLSKHLDRLLTQEEMKQFEVYVNKCTNTCYCIPRENA